MTANQIVYRYQKHFKRLQLWYKRLKSDLTANPKLQRTLHKLIMRKNARDKTGVTPHQFRHAWDTLAMNNKMQTEFRIYHMNHQQQIRGDEIYLHFSKQDQQSKGDEIYFQIADHAQAYFEEYDRAAPKYHYDFLLAKQVYLEFCEEEQAVES
ncbi:MAG: hypothetical protein ACE5OZ_09980 [Candidatus Heimdallarchaeota archaeon]